MIQLDRTHLNGTMEKEKMTSNPLYRTLRP